jgi:hypothetical protein
VFPRCRVESCPQLDLVARPGADQDDGDVGFFGGRNGGGEGGLVIAPALAALRVDDLDGGLFEVGFDAREWGDAVVRGVGDDIVTVAGLVSAGGQKMERERGKEILHEIRHRPDHGNFLEFLLIQRKDTVVFEQHDAFLVDFPGQLHGPGGVDMFFPVLDRGGSVGVLEQTECELGAEDAEDGGIDDFLAELAGFDELGDGLVVITA